MTVIGEMKRKSSMLIENTKQHISKCVLGSSAQNALPKEKRVNGQYI
jgi:hypothetical protein